MSYSSWVTCIIGLMRGLATLPQGNQEPLLVSDKVGRPLGELGVSNSVDCDICPSVLRHCWLGNRKGIWPVKSWVLVCWWWQFRYVISPIFTTTSIILSLASIKPANRDSPAEMAVKMGEREREREREIYYSTLSWRLYWKMKMKMREHSIALKYHRILH